MPAPPESSPLLSVLIPTLAHRAEKLRRLLGVLLPQAEAAGCVEVIGLHNDGTWPGGGEALSRSGHPIGMFFQALLDAAAGEYVCFLDDDDMIPGYFIGEIVPRLRKGPDVVGFMEEYHEGGVFQAVTYVSIHHEYRDTPGKMYRTLTTQSPVRTSLARLGDFRHEWPEDTAWQTAVIPHLRTEEYIGKVMYYYLHSWGDTVQGSLPAAPGPRPVVDSPCFRWLDIKHKETS